MHYNKKIHKDGPPPNKSSRIVSIKGRLPIDISLPEISKFMQNNNLKQRKHSKEQMYKNLVIATEAWKTAKIAGNDPLKAIQLTDVYDTTKLPPTTPNNAVKKEPTVTWSRMINCLFLDDKVKQLLPHRGRCLTKDDLTAGKKTGQDFFESLLEAYNDFEATNIDLNLLKFDVDLHKESTSSLIVIVLL
jgi:hypothetical protein